jgi:hypothetical protein
MRTYVKVIFIEDVCEKDFQKAGQGRGIAKQEVI